MTDDQQQAGDSLARSNGLIVTGGSGQPSMDDWPQIQRFIDSRAEAKPEDFFAFRMIVTSDGLDSYYTRQDPKTSLPNFVEDLKSGRALLGSHQTNTFSYGQSYDGSLVEADPEAGEYESTFYRRHAGLENMRAANWVVSKYYVPRGMTVNGQSTDDLIRGMQMGALRRVSISFSVGRYVCGIDHEDMIAGFFGPEGQGACQHLPGVEYKGEGLAYADMEHNDLHESSLVFRNSTPSAMYLRKAEVLAERGMISPATVAMLEERLAYRLPRHEPAVFRGVGITQNSAIETQQEDQMATDEKRHDGHFHVGLNVDADDIQGGHGVDYTGDPGDEQKDPEAAAEMLAPGVTTPAEPPQPGADQAPIPPAQAASPDGVEERHEGHNHDDSHVGGHFTVDLKSKDQIKEEMKPKPKNYAADEEEEEDALPPVGTGDPVYGRTVAADVIDRLGRYDQRERSLVEELGAPISVSVIRGLKRDAQLGRDLYNVEVEKAIRARAAVEGENFNAEKWRSLLMSSRDIELVQQEITSWTAKKEEIFTPGRQVIPSPIAESKKAPTAPRRDVETPNVFGGSKQQH